MTLNHRRFQMFQSLKTMSFNEDRFEGVIELIFYENQLHYLISHISRSYMSLGRVDDIPFAYTRLLFSKGSQFDKKKINVYNTLITRLYCQIIADKVPSEVISPAFFSVT